MKNYQTNNRFKILTPLGFKDFSGIRKIDKTEYFLIQLSNNTSIKCSHTHKFIINSKEVFAKNIKCGDKIDGKCKNIEVLSIELIKNDIELFDIINVSDGNVFYSNDVVSHNCDFTTTGNTVIEPELLKKLRLSVVDPIEKRWADGSLWIWKYPDYSKSYLVAADVARGDGMDKSAFHIIDLDSCEQVAEFKGVVDTKSYGNLLVSIANEYNKAILVVENNNIGWATLQQVIDLGYPNTFYSSNDLTYVDVERQLVGKINRMEKNMIPGFTLTHKNRPLVVSKMEMYLRENSFKINSIRTWDELSVFIWSTGGRAEAMRGYNDDLVMSMGMGLWVRDTALRLRRDMVDMNKCLLNNISKVQNETIYTSRNEPAINSWRMPIHTSNNIKNPKINNQNDEDLTWLLK